MRIWVASLALLLAACASAEPSTASGGQSSSAQQSSAPNYEDARSVASDEAIRVSRRAYRDACQRSMSADYCECMTASMAQSLAPADLDTASAQLRGEAVSSTAAGRVAPARAQAEAACAQYRRS